MRDDSSVGQCRGSLRRRYRGSGRWFLVYSPWCSWYRWSADTGGAGDCTAAATITTSPSTGVRMNNGIYVVADKGATVGFSQPPRRVGFMDGLQRRREGMAMLFGMTTFT